MEQKEKRFVNTRNTIKKLYYGYIVKAFIEHWYFIWYDNCIYYVVFF